MYNKFTLTIQTKKITVHLLYFSLPLINVQLSTMKNTYFLLFVLILTLSYGQTVISGKISSEGKPISGANISIVDSYDGATSNKEGEFSFETYEEGEKTILVESSDYDFYEENIVLDGTKIHLTIELNTIIQLDAIVFTAGQMSAKSETNKAILKPLDVVTTAGAMGDNIGALQMLPGTQNNAEDGRLFVRGGDPDETMTYVDGMRVQQAYTATSPQTPVRGRFSPFLFKGINFSTGGYGAKFGNAMSGALEMNTINFPKENSVDISLMTVGGGAAVNKVWDKSALSFNAQYFNLGLYNAIFKSRDEWLKSPQGAAGEAVFRQKIGKSLWKTYAAYDFTKLKLKQYHINAPQGETFGLKNNNLYVNSTVSIPLANKTDLLIGGSFSDAKNEFNFNDYILNSKSNGVFGRAEIKAKLNPRFRLTTGTSLDYEKINENSIYFDFTRDNTLWNTYAEGEWSATRNFGIKAGVRNTYSSALDKWSLQPRLSLAYQLSSKQNFSFAYGEYTQMPNNSFWKDSNLNYQSARQFLFNYFYQGKKNTLRAEVYHKKYTDLVTYVQTNTGSYENVDNNGFGEASGLDLFWRNDNDLIKNTDFWISYSYINSERLYQYFPKEAQPSFVPNHTASWVGKYWINSMRSQIGLTYKFSSGRPYTNKNTNDFLAEKTKSYHSVDLGWAYLMSPQKILYFGINNVFNIKNEFGYRYAENRNQYGMFGREPILAQNNQFFFVGFFWTISTNKSKNQLDQL